MRPRTLWEHSVASQSLLDACPDTLDISDEDPPDAWRFDFNGDGGIRLGDVLLYIRVFNQTCTP